MSGISAGLTNQGRFDYRHGSSSSETDLIFPNIAYAGTVCPETGSSPGGVTAGSSLTDPSSAMISVVRSNPESARISSEHARKPIRTKFFFNLIADEFGKNSELEGIYHKEIIEYITKHIQLQQSLSPYFSDVKKHLLSQLEISCRIEKEGLSKILHEAFSSSTPLLILGGWRDFSSGHSTCYEIIPQTDGTANFRIFNTGSGIEYHGNFQIGTKEKVAFLEWRGISQENLLHPYFTQIISEMLTYEFCTDQPAYSPKRTDYNSTDIYERLKAFLAPRSTSSFITCDRSMMEPQRAGTCGSRSLLAFIKTKIPLEEYQRLKLDLRMTALIGLINNPAIGLDAPAEVTYHLMEKATKKLSLRVYDLFLKNVISGRIVIAADEVLRRADCWLKAHRIQKQSLSLDYAFTAPNNRYQSEESYEVGIPLREEHCSQSPRSILIQEISVIPLDDPALLIENISRIRLKIQQAYNNHEYPAVYFGILEIVKKISTNRTFWREIRQSEEGIEEGIQSLGELSTMFFKSCFRIQDPNTAFFEKLYVLHKILFFQQKLAVHLGVKIHLNFRPETLTSLLSTPIIRDELKHIIPQYGPTDFFPTYTENSLEFGKINLLIMDSRDPPYVELLKSKYGGLLALIKQDHIGFDRLQKEVQHRLIFKSDRLPPWMKSIRTSLLCQKFLSNTPIIHIEDPRISLEFVYQQVATGFKISLDGLTPDRFINFNKRYNCAKPNLFTSLAPIQNPMIKELIEDFIFKGNEKKIYSTYIYGEFNQFIDFKTKYSSEFSEHQIKEIAHIFANPKYSLIEALEFFTHNPEKLKDQDYQQLFLIASFTIKSSEEITTLKKQIFKFLKRQIGENRSKEDIPTQVFLQRIGRYFYRYGCEFADETGYLYGLLSQPKTTPEEKSLIYAELAAGISDATIANENHLKFLLEAKAFLEHLPIPLPYRDPQVSFDIEKALSIHEQGIINLLLRQGIPNSSLLNKIYTLITQRHPPEGLSWRVISSSGKKPIFQSSDESFYDPIKGSFIKKGLEKYLPPEIRNHLDFITLFPSQVKAIPQTTTIYEFYVDERKIIIKKTNEGVAIYQDYEGHLMKFIPSNKLTKKQGDEVACSLQSRYIADRYNVWHSTRDSTKLFLYAKKTGKKTYEATYAHAAGKIIAVTRLSDRSSLSVASTLLTQIEDPSYIQEWYTTDKRRIELELPRFNLSFAPDETGRLQCKEHPGFFLSENQNLEAIGQCNYCLILKNNEGKTRLLIPNQRLEAEIIKEPLQPKIVRKKCLDIGECNDFTYFTYDLNSKGQLESPTRQGYFYLALTLAVHHEYQKAAFYLRSYGEKLSEYSENEILSLEEVADVKKITGDNSGEQIAIALYANYLLATNKIRSSKAIEKLPKLYKKYLFRIRNVTALVLSKEEELHLLKSLLPKPLTQQFISRLNPTSTFLYGRSTPPPALNFPLSHESPPSIEGINIAATSPLRPNFQDSVLITRPTDFIDDHLLSFIKIALNGTTEEKKWLSTACLFYGKNSISTAKPLVRAMLEQMLEKPGDFLRPPPSPRTLTATYLDALTRWWEVTARKVEDTPILEDDLPTMIPTVTLSSEPRQAPSDRPSQPMQELLSEFSLIRPPALSESEPFCSFFAQQAPSSSCRNVMELTDLFYAHSVQVQNPVESKEWVRLAEDLHFHSTKPARPLYRLEKSVPEMILDLQRKRASIETYLSYFEGSILTSISIQPEEQGARALFNLQQRGNLVQRITLDDVFISFALKEPKKLLEQNPHLGQGDIKRIYTAAAGYLQQACLRDQIDRSLSFCEKLREEVDNQELIQELANQLNAKCCYDISKNPSYLAFEYYAGIIMREDQVKKLEAFLQGDTPNPVMEMIMGSGKSKILLPLLGLLRANGRDLSMVIVPSSLFESVSSDTQSLMQKMFGKSLKTLHFGRNSTFTKGSLEEIKYFLRDIIHKKQCLIMTSKSIQCLLLKFIEYTNSRPSEEIFNACEFKEMLEIITLLQKAGYPLIDEADTVLNVLHEVSFSMGEKTPSKQEEIHLIGTIYQLLYSDPELKKIARLESDPYPFEKDPDTRIPVPPLSESVYEILKYPLASALIRKLIEQEKLPAGIHQEAVYEYLTRNPLKASESARFFEGQTTEIQNLLALAGEEICSLLPHTLLKTSDERYGLDTGVIAIPFSAANTPCHGSVFSNPYITMNYTFQIHTKNGIQKKTLINLIIELLKQARDQMEAEDIGIEKTIAYEQFSFLTEGLSIPFKSNLDDYQVKQILDRINRTPKIRQDLIERLFLPQIKLFEFKAACNPINLVSFFNKVSGFTGTLWNASSMHGKITPLAEPGTDGKTLSILMQNSSNSFIIPKADLDVTLSSILPHFDALIDAGGYFKEGGNLSIARNIARIKRYPVVFYDSSGIQTITNGTTEMPLTASPLKEDERLTFYDQSHTTGSDIKQKRGAVGLVTIGRGMILRDLLQSVWRLRGLEKGQTVQFVISEEIASSIREDIKYYGEEIAFEQILQYVIQNQGRMQGRDNFIAFKQELENLSQNLLIEVMTSSETLERKKQAFQHLAKTWIQSTKTTPATSYGKLAFPRDTRDVMIERASKSLAELEAIGSTLPFLRVRIEALKEEVGNLQSRFFDRVPPHVIAAESQWDSTAEVEQEVQAEIQEVTEITVETQTHNGSKKIQLGQIMYTPSAYDTLTRSESLHAALHVDLKFPIFPITDQMIREEALTPYKDLFEGIDISVNTLEWIDGETRFIEKMRLIGPHKIPYHHLIVNGDNVTLFSQLEDVLQDPNCYNLTLGFISDPSRQLSDIAFGKVVKIKFLNGESTFTKKELDFLERWFTYADVDKMLHLYLKVILKYEPDKQSAFMGSNLRSLFNRLKHQQRLALESRAGGVSAGVS